MRQNINWLETRRIMTFSAISYDGNESRNNMKANRRKKYPLAAFRVTATLTRKYAKVVCIHVRLEYRFPKNQDRAPYGVKHGS